MDSERGPSLTWQETVLGRRSGFFSQWFLLSTFWRRPSPRLRSLARFVGRIVRRKNRGAAAIEDPRVSEFSGIAPNGKVARWRAKLFVIIAVISYGSIREGAGEESADKPRGGLLISAAQARNQIFSRRVTGDAT